MINILKCFEAINLLKKKIKRYIKLDKKIIKLYDIEIKEYKFHQYKSYFDKQYRYQ